MGDSVPSWIEWQVFALSGFHPKASWSVDWPKMDGGDSDAGGRRMDTAPGEEW